jgi:hypothetical protein
MSSRRSVQHRGTRALGVIFLILGLVHTPLPEPDFHNIRHHDAPGEVCEHHDHLLRWHPAAGIADDVAVLHWHWFLPTAGPFDLSPEHAGSAVHAHVIDWQVSTWEDGPRISADTASRIAGPFEASPSPTLLALPALAHTALPAPGTRRSRTFGATFAPHAHLSCLLQRWVC